MKSDMLTTINEEALEVVSGAGIGAAIGGAVDRLLGGAVRIVGRGLSAIGGLLSGLGGLLGGN